MGKKAASSIIYATNQDTGESVEVPVRVVFDVDFGFVEIYIGNRKVEEYHIAIDRDGVVFDNKGNVYII